MSIQRWKVVDTIGQYAETGDDGGWVTYADHVAAVAEAEQRVERITREDDNRALWDSRQFNAGLDAAREAVAALPFVRPAYYGKGVLIHGAEPDFVRQDALAAIDALRGDT